MELLPFLIMTSLATSSPSSALSQGEEAPPRPGRDVAPFVGVGWRAMNLGDHWSHGPEFQAGVLLWRHLRVGLAGVARPGPINPTTFELVPVGGQTYRGQTQLDLRSDGAIIGLLIGASFSPASWFHIDIPIILGNGQFGFYLTDDDRQTPDGRRVSEWENELQDGRDSSAGFAIDGGVRFALNLQVPWLRPYLGVHYTALLGYDAFLADDYSGFSIAGGLEVGVW